MKQLLTILLLGLTLSIYAAVPTNIKQQLGQTNIILLDEGYTRTEVKDWKSSKIAFAIDKGYGYSAGPFKGIITYSVHLNI